MAGTPSPHRRSTQDRFLNVGPQELRRFPLVKPQARRVRSLVPGPMETRKSSIDGRGLFATARIEGRRKLGELTGEVISQAEARRRARRRRRPALAELGDGTAIDATR